MIRTLLKSVVVFSLFLPFFGHANESEEAEVSLKKDNASEWWQSSQIYHIWVRSYFDSDGDGNGDINGIRQKLSYIEELGVNTLLLSPIFESSSYHGYDVTNHLKIDPTLGTESDLVSLIADAKAIGIRVLLDLPINHTSHNHIWFQKSLAKDEKYADYYRWEDSLPDDYGYPWDESSPATATWHYKDARTGFYYGLFGYDNPDLNLLNPDVEKEVFKIVKYWLNQGVDGFRIDAARHLVEEGPNPLQSDTKSNIAFLKKLVRKSKKVNPNVYFLGEALVDLQTSKQYLKGKNSLDALFNFEFSGELKSLYSVKQHFTAETAIVKDSIVQLYDMLTKNKQTNKEFVVFINNHDFSRQVLLDGAELSTAKVLANLTLLSPFSTALYYGDEIGLQQSSFDDQIFQRAPMQWVGTQNAGFSTNIKTWVDEQKWVLWRQNHQAWFDAFQIQSDAFVSVQQNDPTSLLNHYKKLYQLKKHDRVLAAPTSYKIRKTNNQMIFAIEFFYKDEKRLVIINLDPYTPQVYRLRQRFRNDYRVEEKALTIAPGNFEMFGTSRSN